MTRYWHRIVFLYPTVFNTTADGSNIRTWHQCVYYADKQWLISLWADEKFDDMYTVQPFSHNTDRQMDRNAIAKTCVSYADM